MKSNGCNEDGWDLFEEQTRQAFEYYAVRRGYSVERNGEYNFFYFEDRTEDAWEMYRKGHIDGRVWDDRSTRDVE